MKLLRAVFVFGVLSAPFATAFADAPSKTEKKGEKQCNNYALPACPGGGAPTCAAGDWKCKASPPKKAEQCHKKPMSCPGGGEARCEDGEWKCAPLPHR
jgi:hypothetical protein